MADEISCVDVTCQRVSYRKSSLPNIAVYTPRHARERKSSAPEGCINSVDNAHLAAKSPSSYSKNQSEDGTFFKGVESKLTTKDAYNKKEITEKIIKSEDIFSISTLVDDTADVLSDLATTDGQWRGMSGQLMT